jgi:hypothetical protein
MRKERLDAMSVWAVGYDTETHRIQPGLVAPPLVCGSLAVSQFAPDGRRQIVGELLDAEGARAVFRQLLADPRYTLVGANLAYDLLVLAVDAARRGEDLMPQIFDLFDPGREVLYGPPDGRVFDILVGEALHAIGQGHLGIDPATGAKIRDPKTGKETNRYSLDVVTWLVLGRKNAKLNDRYKEAYASLERTPIAEWPYEAKTYPIDDAVNQLEDGLAQVGHGGAVHEHRWQGDACAACGATAGGARMCWTVRPRLNMHEMSRQAYAAFALSLGAGWGAVVDQAAVDAVEATYNKKHERDLQPFVDAGFLRGPDDKKPYSENGSALARHVAWAYGAREACPTCAGTSKVPSAKTGKPVNCPDCGGRVGATGLKLTELVPRTDTGGVKTDKDSLEESGDDLLVEYQAHCEGAKIPTTYVPYLRHARKEHELREDGTCAMCGDPGADRCQPSNWRTLPLILRPNVLVATGRVSYSDPAQQFPRGWGLRECIVARAGKVFSSIDYKAGELVTHSQDCLDLVGRSELARALNKGLDAHLALAATMLGKSYEWALEHKKDKAVKDARQAAKPPNFGFPGGMGAHKLVLTQRRQGPDTEWPDGPSVLKVLKDGTQVRGYRGLRFCLLMGRASRCGIVKLTTYRDRPIAPTCKACIECAEDIKRAWLKQWPENVDYFKLVNEWNERGYITQMVTKRIRGGVDYCSAANGQFQARLAEAAKNALCQIQRECYDRTCVVPASGWYHDRAPSLFAGGPSPLLGSHSIFFQHDETVNEHDETVAHEASSRAGEIMEQALRIICPDLWDAVEAKPALMRRWLKGAEEVVHHGRLVPWEPDHDPKTCPDCPKKN